MLGCLLVLSSMTKINYHFMGMALVSLFLVARFWTRRTPWKAILASTLALGICGFLLGPMIEILINHATLRSFVYDVLILPSGRAATMSEFLKPRLYVWGIYDYYPDTCCVGVYVLGLIAYLCYAWFALNRTRNSSIQSSELDDLPSPTASSVECRHIPGGLVVPVVLAIFYAGSLLLTVSNVETQILTSVFLLVGLISAELFLGSSPSQSTRSPICIVIALFAGYFLIVGGMSAFMHSRVRFSEYSQTTRIGLNIALRGNLSPLWESLPTYDAEAISPEFKPYFAGVRFTAPTDTRLKRVMAFMARTHNGIDPQDIYWGAGFEMLNRVYGNRLKAYLPLWYHDGVTIRGQDSQMLTQELDRANYQWVVMPSKLYDPPGCLLRYLRVKYRVVEDDEIKVYQRFQP